MVMEAPPTPQCVGREFVRQYYTLLNKAPAHLHRFYNNNSSFVHGGLDASYRETKPLVGQRQIHQKIQQLNFRDCHAKISQVDSQATLGDGVVVQVTGELSNGGQPMRRFTQTFVLAAQSPKKYYVHNDIFRYQDMLMSDEDAEHDSGRSETEDDTDPAVTIEQQPPQQPPSQTQPYYPHTHTQMVNSGPTQIMPPTVNGLMHVEDLAPAVAPVPAPVAVAPPVQPAQAVQAPIMTAPVTQQAPPAPIEEPLVAQEIAEVASEPVEEVGVEVDTATAPEEIGEAAAEEEKPESVLHDSYEEPPTEAVLNEPKTYATLLKSSSSHTGSSPLPSKTTPTSPPPLQQRMDHSAAVTGPAAAGGPQRPGMARPGRGGAGNVRGVGRPPTDRQSTGRPPYSDDSDGERRRSGPSGSNSSYPDSNQLFLGNLPHHATEEELKKLFSQYGPVADLRIHSKTNNPKGLPGTKVPNYGFITFEDAASVKNVLEKRPIMFDGHQKLNVEEKKPRRSEPSSGVPRSGSGDNSMMGRPSNNIGNSAGRGGQPGGAPRGGGGTGMRGRGGTGNFNRGEGGAGGQGGSRGAGMGMNNSGNRGGFGARRQ